MTWTPPEPGPPGGTGGWPSGAPQAAEPPPWAPPPYAWAPPRPGVVPLRPLGVGELLDGAFTTVRRYPRATLGFAVVVMLVVQGVQLALDYGFLNGLPAPSSADRLTDSQVVDLLARAGVVWSVSLLVTGIGGLLLTGMITAVIGRAVLGRPMGLGEAWRALRPLVPRLMGVSLLTFAIAFGAFALPVLPGVLLVVLGAGPLGAVLLVIGVLGGGVLGLYLGFSLALAPAACVLERQTVRGALRRSRALVRGSWWRVFGVLLLTAIVAQVVSFIVESPFSIVAGAGAIFGNDSGSYGFGTLLVSGAGALLAGTLVRPFVAGVSALLYVDRRMRAEALDVTLAHAAAQNPPA